MPTPVPKLIIRQARLSDIANIQELSRKAYPGFIPYSLDQIRGHINHYPEGCMVAEYDGAIVGYCASIRLPEALALKTHTWREITGGGYGSTHDPNGDFLYGYEVCVDPDHRGMHIGQRLYTARRKLCVDKYLKGIVFGGRIPGLKRRLKEVGSAEEYIKRVKNKSKRDPVMTFQMRNGFEPIGVLKDYMPSDEDSLGFASHMVWKNPAMKEKTLAGSTSSRRPGTVRVATLQYLQRRISSFDEFARIAGYFVKTVADDKSDFILFPELFTVQLLSIENEALSTKQAFRYLADYTDQYKTLFQELAIKNNVNIIAGSHPTRMPDDSIQNIAYVFLRDGSVHEQPKIHPTVGSPGTELEFAL